MRRELRVARADAALAAAFCLVPDHVAGEAGIARQSREAMVALDVRDRVQEQLVEVGHVDQVQAAVGEEVADRDLDARDAGAVAPVEGVAVSQAVHQLGNGLAVVQVDEAVGVERIGHLRARAERQALSCGRVEIAECVGGAGCGAGEANCDARRRAGAQGGGAGLLSTVGSAELEWVAEGRWNLRPERRAGGRS